MILVLAVALNLAPSLQSPVPAFAATASLTRGVEAPSPVGLAVADMGVSFAVNGTLFLGALVVAAATRSSSSFGPLNLDVFVWTAIVAPFVSSGVVALLHDYWQRPTSYLAVMLASALVRFAVWGLFAIGAGSATFEPGFSTSSYSAAGITVGALLAVVTEGITAQVAATSRGR